MSYFGTVRISEGTVSIAGTPQVRTLGVLIGNSSTLAITDDFFRIDLVEDLMIQIEGDCDCEFVPEMQLNGTWRQVAAKLFTDITTGDPATALVNGAIYTLDILGLIYSFRIRAASASSGSSTVQSKAKTAVYD